MIVDLNTKAFSKAKQNDIFIIEEKNGKKYAKNVDRTEFLKDIYDQLEKAQLEIMTFKEIVAKQKELIEELTAETNEKLVKIAQIVGGYENEETNI